MKTLKHLFSLFLFLIISISSFAQSSGLSVKRFEDVSSVKQYARTQPRKDNNGEPAALVLVQVLASNIQVDFTANYLLGNVEKKASEYWVYMAAGAKSLEVHCDGYEKIRVDFSEISKGQIPSLVKQCTYELVISVPGMMQNTTQAPQRQFFKFRVNPSNAVVTVWENGKEQILPMKEGVASKMFNYGTYSYRISANRYYSEEGSFTLSDTQREMSVTLRPKFGYLTVQGDNTSQGAYLFATNAQTGDMTQLGTIPLSNKELDAGTYTLHVQQNKYKDYSKTIVIEEGKTTSVRPVLDANFAQVTLTTQEGADILLDGSRLGTGRYSGTLELGEYVIETRQAGHKSSYTTLTITPQSTGKTIALNNPVPIYGTLIVDGDPSDIAVYVDNKKEGTTPLVINKLLVGTHNVRLEKEGYDKQEKTVTISEGQELKLDYTLTKVAAKSVQPTLTSTPGVIAPPVEAPVEEEEEDVVFEVVESMPEFPGGSLAMMKYIAENIKYPAIAQENGIQGRVICQFVVEKDGKVSDVRVVRSSGEASLDKEAVRVINSMPKWNPGKQRGQLVRVKYTAPVSFRNTNQNPSTIIPSSAPQNQQNIHNGHEYVDLGLSVKWATCNVGANKPEDYGDYFAWGETKPKTTYYWVTYKWCRGSYDKLTKYNDKSSNGTIDNKTQLELSDDAARANWGGTWRMPTSAEQDELREQCTWTWTSQNGVNGYKVTSKKNGNNIFIPAAGFRTFSSLDYAGSYGYFWSSSLNTHDTDFAWYVGFYSSRVGRDFNNRYYGLSVRPVCP